MIRCIIGISCIWLCFVANCAVGQQQLLKEKQLREGWLQIFDGETLFGWETVGDAEWSVEDGEIRTNGKRAGFLSTTTQWESFVLTVQFKAPESTNSGIFIHSELEPRDPKRDCIEINIAPKDNPFPTGSLVARKKNENVSKEDWDAEKWHNLAIHADDVALTLYLDGEKPFVYIYETKDRFGHIALQSREGPISFRNIFIQPFEMKPIFNGKNLEGWNTELAKASKFDVTDAGELHVTNGSGQLESNDRYGDFLLQFECKTNGDHLNSGMFFRCIPGELMNGYECQIQNGFKDGNPTKPTDGGTGGIYRRVPARKVMSRDHEWFALTVLADGPHIATWVNGVQVVNWTDPRPPHENPRNGLRLEPGTFCIQGHDPTTDLLFRKLKIVELPE